MTHLIAVRVLVIDDEESVARRIREFLAGPSLEVVTFTRPPEAMAFASQTVCRVALVDLRMPDVDSTATLENLRSVSPRTRPIAMTAFPEVPQVIAAMRAGARDLLEKPIQPESLRAAVSRQLIAGGVVARSEAEFNQLVGKMVRERRTALGRSLAQVADAGGLTPQQVSQIERGRTGTPIWTLARIAAALDIPLAELLGGR